MGGDPVNFVDPSGFITVFIGEAFDKGQIVGRYQNSFGRDSEFFRHNQKGKAIEFILDALKENPCQPVNIVGHSWGGSSAGRVVNTLAQKYGVETDLLITADPVGYRRGNPRAAKRWVNIYARNNNFRFRSGNTIANIGGQWGNSVRSQADRHITAPFDHAQFGELLNYSDDGNGTALDELLQSQYTSCMCKSP